MTEIELKLNQVNKNKVKVLSNEIVSNLIEFMEYSIDEFIEEEGCIEIKPIFNRNGQYTCRFANITWYEYKGRAWISKNNYSSDFVIWRLNLLSHRRLRQCEFEALELLANNNVLDKSMTELYLANVQIRQTESLKRQTKLDFQN